MILESIVTSVDESGSVNIAPMGPYVTQEPGGDCPAFTLRPFDSSRTYQNLISSRAAVIHVTDDVELFARAAVDSIDQGAARDLVRQIDDQPWWVLKDCHRWFAVTIESIAGDGPRFDLTCRVERSETVRPFFGFNRAKHAVIETAILATRTHILAPELITEELERLHPLVDKTAGPAEHRAFEFLQKTIHERLASGT